MKRFILFLILLVAAAAGALAYAVSRAGDIVAEYKPELEHMASESLGSTVTLGNLTASVFPKAQVIVDSARVADPDNPEQAISIGQVSLELELLPLLSGNVVITSLNVIDPTIVASLEEDGIFIEGMPRTDSSAPATETTPAKTPTTTKASAPVTVDLKSFTISGASITVNDKIAEATYTVDGLSLDASLQFAKNKVHLSKVSGEGELMNVQRFSYVCDTIRYGLDDGTIGLDSLQPTIGSSYVLLSGDLNLADASKQLNIASDNIIIDDFRKLLDIFGPAVNEFKVTGLVKPNLDLNLTPTGYNMEGSMMVSGFSAEVEDLLGIDNLAGTFRVDATESKQTIKTDSLKGTMNGAPITVAMTATLDPETAQIKPMTVTGFGGSSTINTKLDLTDESYPFESQVDSTGKFIEQLIPAFAPDMPFAVTGLIREFKGNIGGSLDENMMPSLKGKSNFDLGDGLIKDVNLGKQILGDVSGLPFLSGALVDKVPASVKGFLSRNHTVLEEVSGTFDLHDELMHTDDLTVKSDFFTFLAKGTIGLDSDLKLDSTILFSQEFSSAMVNEVRELKAMMDERGHIKFPVRIEGIAPNLTTKPDLSGVMKNAVSNEAEKLITEQLGEEVGGNVGGAIKNLLGGRKKKD